MKIMHNVLVVVGVAIAGAGSAVANGDYYADCVVPGATRLQTPGGGVAFFSANTNAGQGNGGEMALLVSEDGVCLSGLPTDDKGVQLGNALDPFWGFIATDPGNSK